MKLKEPTKSALFALLRIGALFATLYVVVGCILFPLWWKDFIWGGGWHQGLYWRDGFSFLVEQFKTLSPLAGGLLFIIISVVGYAIYRYGQISERTAVQRANFFKKLPPSAPMLWFSAGLCLVALIAASIQKGTYSDAKVGNRFTEMLREMGEKDYWRSPSLFKPPSIGVYLYVDDNLVLRQHSALSTPLEISEVTEKTSAETNASASLSLPLSAGSATLGKNSGSERTVTKTSPTISPSMAAQLLISRFDADTNTFKLSDLFPDLGYRSGLLISQLKELGVELNSDQLATLRSVDQTSFKKNLGKVQIPGVVLCRGDALVHQTNETFQVKMKFASGPLEVAVFAPLESGNFTDQMRFLLKTRKPGSESTLQDIRIYGVVARRTDIDASHVTLEVIPYSIW